VAVLAVVVVVAAAVVVVVVAPVAVTPQVDWPMMRSPAAVGPRMTWWAALTVSEPPGLATCSLKT